MPRMFIRLMLGMLVALAVSLPLLLNKRNYAPMLDKAHAVVTQSQVRAREIDQLSSDGPSEDESPPEEEQSTAAREVQQLSRAAVAKGGVTLEEAQRMHQAMEELARERRELADQ